MPPEIHAVNLCIMGENPFGDAFDRLESRKNIRESTSLIMRQQEGMRDIESCHIVFISASEQRWAPRVLTDIRHRSILTIGESEDFIEQGGMINFILIDNKIQFEVNVSAAQRAGLEVSSKLLRLAQRIVTNDE